MASHCVPNLSDMFDRITFKLSKRLEKTFAKRLSDVWLPSGQDQNHQQQHATNSHQESRTVWHEGEKRPRNVIIVHVEELGNVRADSTRVERDLGFQGKIGEHVLLTYGESIIWKME